MPALTPWVLLLLALGRRRGVSGTGLTGRPTGPKPQTPQLPMPQPQAGRPSGDPLGRNCGAGEYNAGFWPTKASVKGTFEMLGYPVPMRETMNALGPDGQLGGGDDVASPAVAKFQDDYNFASGRGLLGGSAGGLETDGFVGPCTLNALENVMLYFDNAASWQTAVASNAAMA